MGGGKRGSLSVCFSHSIATPYLMPCVGRQQVKWLICLWRLDPAVVDKDMDGSKPGVAGGRGE